MDAWYFIRSKKKNKDIKRRGGGGFAKLCKLSPELQKFTGVPELARTEVWQFFTSDLLNDILLLIIRFLKK